MMTAFMTSSRERVRHWAMLVLQAAETPLQSSNWQHLRSTDNACMQPMHALQSLHGCSMSKWGLSRDRASPEGKTSGDELIQHHPQTPEAAKHKPHMSVHVLLTAQQQIPSRFYSTWWKRKRMQSHSRRKRLARGSSLCFQVILSPESLGGHVDWGPSATLQAAVAH